MAMLHERLCNINDGLDGAFLIVGGMVVETAINFNELGNNVLILWHKSEQSGG